MEFNDWYTWLLYKFYKVNVCQVLDMSMSSRLEKGQYGDKYNIENHKQFFINIHYKLKAIEQGR